MSWTLLANGERWEIANPDPKAVDIETIAHALSRIPRFCGHTLGERPYSVAQHCCEVAALLPRDTAIHGLLHDAHEAFTGDIPTPIKQRLPGLDDLEASFDFAIYTGLGIVLPTEAQRSLVKHADRACFNAEFEQLMEPGKIDWEPYATPYRIRKVLNPKPAKAAADDYVRAFRRLTT